MTNAPAPLITPPKLAAPVPVVTVRVAPSNVISPPVVQPPCRYAKLLSKPSRASNTHATLLKVMAPVPTAPVEPARRLQASITDQPVTWLVPDWSKKTEPNIHSVPPPLTSHSHHSTMPSLTLRKQLPDSHLQPT